MAKSLPYIESIKTVRGANYQLLANAAEVAYGQIPVQSTTDSYGQIASETVVPNDCSLPPTLGCREVPSERHLCMQISATNQSMMRARDLMSTI